MTINDCKVAFSDLVYDIGKENIPEMGFIEFQFVLKIIINLIYDNRETELLRILKFHFPEYYKRIMNYKMKQ